MKDPVCGMDVEPEKATASTEWRGETWYFCSQGCREKFVADPGDILRAREEKEKEKAQEAAGAKEGGREYTCPMHPEVVQEGPGSCPICGMDLEPKTVSAEEEENPELIAMTRRFWVSLVLSVPVLVLAMSADLLPGGPVQHLLAARTSPGSSSSSPPPWSCGAARPSSRAPGPRWSTAA